MTSPKHTRRKLQQRLSSAMTLILHGVLVAHVGVACMPVRAHVLHVPAIVVRGAVPVRPILHLMWSRRREVRPVTYNQFSQHNSKFPSRVGQTW